MPETIPLFGACVNIAPAPHKMQTIPQNMLITCNKRLEAKVEVSATKIMLTNAALPSLSALLPDTLSRASARPRAAILQAMKALLLSTALAFFGFARMARMAHAQKLPEVTNNFLHGFSQVAESTCHVQGARTCSRLRAC